MRTSVRRSEKGFTLIELGIVVAVIAILATVVLFGRGFLDSAATSKGVEAVNAIRKGSATYVGVRGGTWDAALIIGADLVTRDFIPQIPWDVSNNVSVLQVHGETISGTNTIGICFNTTSDNTALSDIMAATTDSITGGTVNSKACGIPLAAGTPCLCVPL